MNRLDRYFSVRIASMTLQAALVLVTLFVIINYVTEQRYRIEAYEVPWSVVGQFYLTSVPGLLIDYHLLPISVLLAVVFTYGRAVHDREVTAWLASGVRIQRIALPAIALSLMFTAAAYWAVDTVGVHAAAARTQIQDQYFEQSDASARGISWTNLADGWTLHVLDFNERAMNAENVYLHRIESDRADEIEARRMYWEPEAGRWILEDGVWFRFDRAAGMMRTVSRVTQEEAPIRETPPTLFALDTPAATKGLVSLANGIERARDFGLPVNVASMAWFSRLAHPAFVFVLALVALPVALRVRSQGRLAGIGLAVGIAAGCLLVHYVFVGLGYLGALGPLAANVAAPIGLGLAGMSAFMRTPT